MVDGTFRRAVPADVLPPEAEVLSFARQAGGYRGGLCGDAGGLPQAHLRRDSLPCHRYTRCAGGWGAYLGVLARSCVFDADTGRELTRAGWSISNRCRGRFPPSGGRDRVYGAVSRAGGNGQRIGCGGRGGRRIAAGRSGAARAGRVLTLPSGRPFAASLPEGWRKKRRSQQPEWLRSAFFVFRGPISVQAQARCSVTISCGRSSTC